MSKVCNKCNALRTIDNYHRDKKSPDGRVATCKICKKEYDSTFFKKKKEDIVWLNNRREKDNTKRKNEKFRKEDRERKRGKPKKTSTEKTITYLKTYRDKYPEKEAAHRFASYNVIKKKGFHGHHWSYNEDHFTDVIYVPENKHLSVHRFLEYDPISKMYKSKEEGALLNTKEAHEEYINKILKTDL